MREGTAELANAISAAWPGPPAPSSVRLLPGLLPCEELPATDELIGAEAGLAVGIHERGLSPMRLDFGADPHFFLLTDTERRPS